MYLPRGKIWLLDAIGTLIKTRHNIDIPTAPFADAEGAAARKSIVDELRVALAEADLKEVGITTESGQEYPVPRHHWRSSQAWETFRTGRTNFTTESTSGLPGSNYSRRGRVILDEAEFKNWAQITTERAPVSGVAGRPSSKLLVLKELERRIEQGELLPTLSGEGKYMSDFLKNKHSDWPPMTPKSAQNVIRDGYNAGKLRAQSDPIESATKPQPVSTKPPHESPHF